MLGEFCEEAVAVPLAGQQMVGDDIGVVPATALILGLPARTAFDSELVVEVVVGAVRSSGTGRPEPPHAYRRGDPVVSEIELTDHGPPVVGLDLNQTRSSRATIRSAPPAACSSGSR